MSQAKTLLYFSDSQLLIYQLKPKQIHLQHSFVLNLEGQSQFSAWVLEQLKPIYQPVLLVIDSRQEEYELNIVPHVRGRNRQALWQHKLQRLYPNTPYSHACLSGRAHSKEQGSKRQDDLVLFTALGNSEQLQPWIRILLTERISVQGIYSLPLLCETLVNKLELPDNVLLISASPALTHNQKAGLRQSFFYKAHLRANRLIPLPDFATAQQLSYPEYLSQEITKTHQYLSGRSLVSRDDRLTVVFLLPPKQIKQLQHYYTEHPHSETQFRFLNLFEFLQQQGIKHYPKPAFFHYAALKQLHSKHPQNHYANEEERFYYKHLCIRHNLNFFSLLVLFVIGLVSAVIGFEGWEVQQQNTELSDKTQALNNQYRAAQQQQKQRLGIDIDPRHIRNAVEVARKLRQQQVTPYPVLKILGQTLQKFPELRLKNINWALEEVENPLLTNNSNAGGLQAAFLEKQRALGKLSSSFQQVVSLQGQVWSLRHDLPRAQRTLEAFVRQLQQFPELKVQLIKQPLNIANPTQVFKDSLNVEAKRQADAEFSLNVVFKLSKE